MLTADRLKTILEAMPRTRVAVLGDFCLDVYWFLELDSSELSLETGKPTQPVREQRYSLGGAGNVVANLRELGVGELAAFSAVGNDPFGGQMLVLLNQLEVDCAAMLQGATDAWQTLAYCKPYVGDEELSRLDLGDFNRLPDALADRILERLANKLPELDLVIVNQQVRAGLHTPYFRQQLRRLMQDHPKTTFVFDGRHEPDCYPEAVLKLNAHEAFRLCGGNRDVSELVTREEALTAAKTLYERTQRPVFVTRGERGCAAHSAAGAAVVPGLEHLGGTDPVGAGDSFLAGLAASLAAGATPEEAAQVGNFVAGVTVGKLKQTGTATPAEVLEIGSEPRYIYEPELAEDPRRARYWEDTEGESRHGSRSHIEILEGESRHGSPDKSGSGDSSHIEILEGISRPRDLKYAIFDHDGTISALRQGWEEVMNSMMIKAVLGEQYESADESLYRKVVERVAAYIDQTTGVQTLVQMQGLVKMVREFALAPEKQVLDEFGYKAIYNEALMTRVRDRLGRLERGELGITDFVIKNAVELLRALHQAGIRLYLASGTDTEDVAYEATAMGYAELFEGRIYGAVGDVTKEAKRIVLDRILQEIGQDGEISGQLVTFGDGPVEIRETRRRGALAIGVASDEIRRFGLNPAKRARLIRAGAAAIIPDFSQLPALLRFLNLPPIPA